MSGGVGNVAWGACCDLFLASFACSTRMKCGCRRKGARLWGNYCFMSWLIAEDSSRFDWGWELREDWDEGRWECWGREDT